METTRKRGGQSGNQNAKRRSFPRVVLSLTEDDFGEYIREFQEQHNRLPDESDLKAMLKRTIRTDKQEVMHLYVKVQYKDALAVREIIESLFGQVRSIELRDFWFSESDLREIYYQRQLKTSLAYDPEMLESWEIEELKKGDLTHDNVWTKVHELQANPLIMDVICQITKSSLPERW